MLNRKTMRTMAGVGAVALAAGMSYGQCTMQKLTTSDRAASDFFGGSLFMYSSNNAPRLMAGVPADDTGAGSNAGSVAVFARLDANQPWGQLTQFFAADGQPNDFFGVSVGASDPYAVVGATGAGDAGAVYFFERVGPDWVQRTKATPAGSELGADVGRSVAISGSWAIVGAPLKDVSGQANAGTAYFYERQLNGTWLIRESVFPSPMLPVAETKFGSAVAMSGSLAVVGAPYGENINWPADHGFVRIFRRDANNSWQVEQSFVSNNPGEGDHYGAAVATDGSFIAIGAPEDDRSAAQGGVLVDSGCVYIQRFSNGSWTIDGQLFAADGAAGDRFGSSVAIKDGRLVIGAAGAKKAYIFRRTGDGEWVQDAVVGDPEGGDQFASAVAWDGQTAMIGDQQDDPSGIANAGAAYVYRPSTFVSDSCGGAMPIIASSYSGCTSFASRDGSSTCGVPSTHGPDLWYAWTPTCSGTAVIDTAGSLFDTILSVHTGCPDGASTNTVVCNDDYPGLANNASRVSFAYDAGTRYLIRISGFNGASGEYLLNVDAGDAPANDNCAAAQAISDGVHQFATCLATTDGPLECGASQPQIYKDVWFSYTAPTTGTTTVSLCGSSFDTKAAVYFEIGGGCPTQAGTALACNDDAPIGTPCGGTLQSFLTFQAVGGLTYTIRVGGYGTGTSSAGDATMQIFTTGNCPADWNGDGAVNSNDISAFLTSWLGSVSGGTLVADFNGDMAVNSNDISAFLTAWLAAVGGGC